MLIILLVYGILLLIWLLIAIIAIYHNIEYYEPKSKMKYGLHGFIWASVLGMALSFYLLYSIDWSKPININF